jgi:membrane protein YqaA with SNARE-associated domain
MKLKKIDLFLLIFLAILVVLTIIFIVDPAAGNAFSLSEWTEGSGEEMAFWTGLGFIAIVCFLGALVPFPVPYTLIVSMIATQFWNDPTLLQWRVLAVLIMIIVATLANISGDFFDWLIGYGAAKMKENSTEVQASGEKTEEKTKVKTEEKTKVKTEEKPPMEANRWTRIIMSKPHLIPFVIFLFGLTPLPDSLLLMPLGLVKYSVKKTMMWSAIGKFGMMSVVSVAGIVGLNWLLGLLGGAGGSWVSGMVLLYACWLLVLVMTKL